MQPPWADKANARHIRDVTPVDQPAGDLFGVNVLVQGRLPGVFGGLPCVVGLWCGRPLHMLVDRGARHAQVPRGKGDVAKAGIHPVADGAALLFFPRDALALRADAGVVA